MIKLDIGLECIATADVTHGPLRLAVAEHFDIDPADVTADHVEQYEGGPKWQSV